MTVWIFIASLTILAAAGLVLARKRKDAMLALMGTVATVIPSPHGSFRQLMRELERARRYRRPLSLVLVSLEGIEPAGTSHGSNGGGASHQRAGHAGLLVPAMVGRLVRDALRQGDLLAYNAAHNRYIVALPETDRTHALLLAARLQLLVWERVALRLSVAVTEFPSDALTVEELLSKAEVMRAPISLYTDEKSASERPLASSEAA